MQFISKSTHERREEYDHYYPLPLATFTAGDSKSLCRIRRGETYPGSETVHQPRWLVDFMGGLSSHPWLVRDGPQISSPWLTGVTDR